MKARTQRKRRGWTCAKCGAWFGWIRHYFDHVDNKRCAPPQPAAEKEAL